MTVILINDRHVPLYILQKRIYCDIGGPDKQLIMICEFKQVPFGVKANGVAANIVEAFSIQSTGKTIWKSSLQIIKELERINISEILICRSNQLAVGSSCNCCLNIRRKQTETRLLDKAYREIKCLAHIYVSLQLINKLRLTIVCIKTTLHICLSNFLYQDIANNSLPERK